MIDRLKEKYADDKEFIANVTQCNIRYDTIVSTGVTGFFKDKQYYSTFKNVLQENDGQSYLQMLKNADELTFPPPIFTVLPKFNYPHPRERIDTNGDDRNSNSDSRNTSGGRSGSHQSGSYGVASRTACNTSVEIPNSTSYSNSSGSYGVANRTACNTSAEIPNSTSYSNTSGSYGVASRTACNTSVEIPNSTSYSNSSGTPRNSQSQQSTISSVNTFNPYSNSSGTPRNNQSQQSTISSVNTSKSYFHIIGNGSSRSSRTTEGRTQHQR